MPAVPVEWKRAIKEELRRVATRPRDEATATELRDALRARGIPCRAVQWWPGMVDVRFEQHALGEG